MAESEKETASQGFHFICVFQCYRHTRGGLLRYQVFFFFRQSQSYLHEIAKIWEERRDIDILERVLRESEKERESAALMDYTYKEVIQEEDVNRYNIRREIHTRKFPSSCIVYSCWLFCWTTHLYA